MSHFTTGLEGLMEKIAVPVMRSAPRPRPSAAPGRAPKPPLKVTPPAPGSPAAPKPAAPAVPKPVAGKVQPGYTLTPAEKAQAAKLKNMPPADRGPAIGLPATAKSSPAARAIDDKRVMGAGGSASATPSTPAAGAQVARKRWGWGKRLGVGAGLGLGAMALGTGFALHKEHQRDQQHRGLAYAPMSGTAGTSGLY